MGFPFYFDDNKPKPDLDYQYDTQYPTRDPVLRFTKTDDSGKALQKSTGRILYTKTVPFGPKVNFNSTVKFKITDNSPGSGAPIADGLAFFIVPEGHKFPDPPPPLGGNLGLFDQNGSYPGVFAAAFDTYIGEVPNSVTLGIDIENRTPKANKDVPHTFIGKKLTLVVSYDAAATEINASVTDDTQTIPAKFTYNLTNILPHNVTIGLASTTGQNVAVHDVTYWDFTTHTAP